MLLFVTTSVQRDICVRGKRGFPAQASERARITTIVGTDNGGDKLPAHKYIRPELYTTCIYICICVKYI